MNLEGTNLSSNSNSILKNQSLQYFACEPHLVTTNIINWIKNQNLVPFKHKVWKRTGFFDFPAIK